MGCNRTWMLVVAVVALCVSSAVRAGDPAPSPSWEVTESIVPLTGTSSVVAQLPSTNALTNMIGAPETATLVLRCQEQVLAAYVYWPQVLQITGTSFGGGTTQTMVLWKLDQSAIAANFWDRSDAGTAAGKFTTGGATKLVAKLVAGHRLVVRMTGSSTQDAIFDLGDMQTVAAKVGKPCGVQWTQAK